MSEYLKCMSAVFPVPLRVKDGAEQAPLHLRANTGYMDGRWDFAGSGHVEEGESTSQALCRECGEELGIDVRPENTRFLHLSHRLGRTHSEIIESEEEPL